MTAIPERAHGLGCVVVAPPATELRPRAPLLLPVAAFAAGIALDHALPDVGGNSPGLVWLTAAAMGLSLWLACHRRARNASLPQGAAAAVLLAACAAVGAAWHHSRVHWAASDDLCWFATAEERPLHLIGRLATEPEIVPPGAPDPLQPFVAGAVSYVVIEPREVRTSGGALTVRGRSRVRVLGDLVHVHAGDLIELHGRFRLPPTPGNPGEFDAAAWLRRNGIRTVIDVSHPAHVVRLAPGRDITGQRWRAAQQRRLADGLRAHLGERLAPVAVALLLGPRSQIDAEIYDAFESTGTLHLLAISGINVALLAGFLWGIGRIAGVSPAMTNVLTAALLIAYAGVTDARPPVVRAVLFLLIWLFGNARGRASQPWNALAATAGIVLAVNPANLFDVGAQLSFLAVAGLIWSSEHLRRVGIAAPAKDAASVDLSAAAAAPPDWRSRLARSTCHAVFSMAAVWLATLPIVASQFRVISPAGFLLNLLLIPIMAAALGAGYMLLAVLAVLPPLAVVAAPVFEVLLGFAVFLVEFTSRAPGARLGLPDPTPWSLAAYGAGMAGLMLGTSPTQRRMSGRLLAGTAAAAAVVSFAAAPDKAMLRCTVLDVGHGLAAVVECPNGATLLIDCGSTSGDRSSRAVKRLLFHRGKLRIDAALISHSDLDHFNGLPRLADAFPVGSVLVAPRFVADRSPAVSELIDALDARGVPVHFVWRGDRLELGETVLEVLHPPAAWPGRSDNAASLAIELRHAGRRLLFLGDLEARGLGELTSQPARRGAVLIAPHHGSRLANTPALAAWAQPAAVIVSTDRSDVETRLAQTYGSVPIVSTARRGAATVTVDAAGKVQLAWHRANADIKPGQ